MLPDFRYDKPGLLPDTASVINGVHPDLEALDTAAHLIQSGVPAVDILANDTGLKKLLDTIPVDRAIDVMIPQTEDALTHADAQKLTLIIQACEETQEYPDATMQDAFKKYKSYSNRLGDLGVGNTLYDHAIRYVCLSNTTLSLEDKPKNLRFIKGLNPKTILQIPDDQAAYDLIQAKLTKNPCVVSVYENNKSMTYYGVGVEVNAKKIYRAYATDIGSGSTTQYGGPKLNSNTADPQLTDWESVSKCADIEMASRLSRIPIWYPEFWIEREPTITSVIVRPYSAWVHVSKVTGFGKDDGNRALSAVLLARALGNIPIKILP